LEAYKILVKRIGLVGVTNLLVALNTILLIPILTKTVGASDYGIWVQVVTTFYLLTSVANLGFPFTMIRFLSAETDRKKIQEGFYSMLTFILSSSFIILMILLIFSKELAISLFNGNISVVWIMAFSIFFGSLNSLLIDYFITFSQIKRYSILLLLQTYASLFLVTYFALYWHSISMIVFGFMIAQVGMFIIMISIVVSEIGFKIPKFNIINDFLSFSLPTIPSNLSNWIVESSDRYVIGIVLGTAFVGYYSPGYILGMVILLFSTPLALLLTSSLPKYYENGQMEDVISLINYSVKYFLLISIPIVFGLSIMSKQIITIISTPEIASNGYLITPFAALSALLFGVYTIIINLIVLEKKTKIIGSIWVVAALISLLNIIFVPYFGILAAAAVTLLSYLFAFFVSLNYSLKYFELNFDLSFILKSLFASVVMSFIIFLINPSGIINIICVIGISIVIYLLFMFITNGIDMKEVRFFKRIFN
jgi:O-antigen/teichoic acid export membrane protein